MYVRNSGDRFHRSLYSEHQADEPEPAAENVVRQPFENIASSNTVRRNNSMDINIPDTVPPAYGTAIGYDMHVRGDNAYSSVCVYGSTLGNSPLATPSTGIREQLSIDQLPSFEQPSYMSLLKRQVKGHLSRKHELNSV